MPHDHGHAHLDPGSGDRRVAIAIWANAALTLAQILGGLLSGSLALIADALHNLSDMAALVIAFAARKIARRPADARMTFGYGRIEVVAALINYTTLILVGAYLIYEGGLRLIDPPAVAGWTVVILGGLALLVDAIRAVLGAAIVAGGSTLRDYARPDGELGYFSTRFDVYGRTGESCRREDGGHIARIEQGGRSTWYCPVCQR